jgi:CRISPR-associated protein Cas1
MPTLYVTEPGARLEREYHRLLVTLEDQVLLSVPLSQVSQVVLVGAVGATTPALLALLDLGIGLTLIRSSGSLRGRLEPAEQPNLALRHRQYACAQDAAFCLGISRAIVTAKIKNSRTLALRIARQPALKAGPSARQARQAIADLGSLLTQAPQAASLAELRGLEGLAARRYYAVYRLGLRPEFHFPRRTRRPPKDPANALLSLAYSLLTQAAITACRAAGLDPYDGFYHADKYGRPALALDLVEEFRALIADSVVLTAINKRICQPKDFQPGGAEEGGVYLSRPGLRAFLAQFSRRLACPVFHPQAGRPVSYQKVLEIQARRLRKAIETGIADYTPFLGR